MEASTFSKGILGFAEYGGRPIIQNVMKNKEDQAFKLKTKKRIFCGQ